MALTPLATAVDLAALLKRDPYTGADLEHVNVLLDSASGAVRDGAGQLFTRTTSTVALPGTADQRMVLPQRPVVSVVAVSIDGLAVTDHKLVAGELVRSTGWGHPWVEVSVAYTHGYVEIPRPVRDLVLAMTASALAYTAEGALGPTPGVQAERIGSYSVTYAINPLSGQPAALHAFELPDATRRWLRSTYGTAVQVVRSL